MGRDYQSNPDERSPFERGLNLQTPAICRESWWIGVAPDGFTDRANAQQARMRQETADASVLRKQQKGTRRVTTRG